MRIRDVWKLIRAAWPNKSLEEFAEEMRQGQDAYPTRAGVPMGPSSAMGISAFFCGVNLIMGAMASMKCVLYRRTGEDSRERFRDHPLYRVLHDRANPYLTAHAWKRAISGQLVLWGSTRSIMLRDPYRGTITGVEKILDPSQVKKFVEKKTGRPSYDITYGPGEKETLTREGPRFVFDVPGPGFSGQSGFSLLGLARESMGLTAAMEIYGQQFFGKGVHTGGFVERPLEAPKFASDEARQRFMESIAASYSGLQNQGKYVLLEEGSKFNPNIMPLEDAQFLTSRTFQIDEVARWLNLSPARLKELSRATFSNIEQLQIMDLQDCFLPWASLIEAEMNAQLIEPDMQDRAFAEFDMDSLLRADTVSEANALALERQWGITNADEWRAKKNRNPQPDGQGKKYLVPSNYTVADKIGENPAPGDAKSPTAPSPAEPDQAQAKAPARLDIRVGAALRKKRFENITYDQGGVMIAADIIEEELNGEEAHP
jgi:HK97 family phage portal protein